MQITVWYHDPEWPGHEHSLLDTIAFPSYPRHAQLERDLAIWLTKEVFDKLSPTSEHRNGNSFEATPSCPTGTTSGHQNQSPQYSPSL
ncbi:hypothetical protein TNCV_4672211 [Trichonephila clavipes]|nr:hypothetical protein TNCV_4672211 [Trichonephila clavipes]